VRRFSDRIMFAALHGELARHPWRDPLVASSDPYSLFVARSSALGLLADARPNAPGGVWAMNDGGPKSGEQSPLRPPGVAWFHVSLPRPIPAGEPLPTQAFLACASRVVARMGTLRLREAQLLLPVQGLDAPAGASSRMDAVMALVAQSGWFTDGDPRAAVQVRVTLVWRPGSVHPQGGNRHDTVDANDQPERLRARLGLPHR
jgi:hypothetical protein